ncbi:MAG: metallophosphoesterase [Bacteroidota bacterium]|nr:metallophosphoesterase [Bacteroidota bacterium]
MKKIFLFLIILIQAKGFSQTTTLLSNGSSWKYLDNGSNQGTAWYGTSFVDASWASGNAELGYGDGDEATVVSYGPSSSSKYVTTYFRKVINIPSTAGYLYYTINFRRDDGSVIYINGTEVNRNNMPTGTITYSTPASSACGDDGGAIQTFTVAAGTFTNGNNTIAVEIHQNNGTSSDITFEFQLLGVTSIPPASLVKGPYLQIGTQNSMVVRWETNIATNTKLAYGTSSTALTSTLGNATSSVTHSVLITGLSPYTKYYYSIGTLTAVIQSGADNYFLTSPVPGTPGNYRFWVTGDCGNGSTNQTNCKNQYLAFTGTTTTNGWLLLGDNAYSSGLNSEFNSSFFPYYQNDIMKNAVLWPAPGNHDYYGTSSGNLTAAYYSIFSTPTSAQAGGVASGSPAYYSYDYGNIHFISLDSYGNQDGNKMYDTLGAQAVWLKADLAANTKRWTIAYWHHPPYTMGSHNSDSETDLVAVRTRFIRILERNKVDLILCGHSHDYERSKLMKGHYGNESSFNAGTHNLSTQSGLYDGSANSCPYLKDSINVKNGTVYVLSGSAGQLGGTQGSFPHNAMHYSNATNGGSFVMDIQNNRLDAKWICADGVIRDKFTIYKDVNSVKVYSVSPTATTNISASWPGSYIWSNAATTNSISVTTSVNATYWVKDPNTCVADTFKFIVSGGVTPTSNFSYSTAPYCAGSSINFNDLSTNSPNAWSWSVTPSTGVTITTPTSQNPLFIFNNSGTYSVTLNSSNGFGAGTSSTKTIVINPNPTVNITPTSTNICSGQSVILNSSGATNYTWNPGALTGASISVSPILSQTYSIVGKNAFGCSGTANTTVSVTTTPTVIASSATICAGGTTTLMASGASNYTWNPGAFTSSNFVVSPSTNTTYTVTGANGVCNDVKTVSVNIGSSVSISVNTPTICYGETTTLTANGVTTFTWNTGSNNQSISVSPLSTTVYTISGTSGSCNGSNTTTVTVNTTPTITAVSNSSVLCVGQSATLSVSGANTYSWSTGASGNSIVVNPSSTFNYSVTGTASNGCQDTTSITQNVTVCTGIETIKVGNNTSIAIFPNPNNGTFVVDIKGNEVYTIVITDITGKLLYNNQLQNGNNLIQLKAETGMYYYTILKGNESINKGKIIIQ